MRTVQRCARALRGAHGATDGSMTDSYNAGLAGISRFACGPSARHHHQHLTEQKPARRDQIFASHSLHDRGQGPRKARFAAGGRFVHALQTSGFCGVAGLCERSAGIPHSGRSQQINQIEIRPIADFQLTA